MSAIKNTQAKKQASLKRDHHVYPWEGDKSFRGAWRRKKARMAKKARAASRQALRRAQAGDEDSVAAPKQPRQLRKTGVVTLERDLQIKKREPTVRFARFQYSSSDFSK